MSTIHYNASDVYEYITRMTSDPIVERKTCRVSGQKFPIFASDQKFYNTISPTFAGKRFAMPTPTLCPEERQRRRYMYRNEGKLYKRKCDFSGKDIISMYAPNAATRSDQRAPLKVYDLAVWYSDQWDALQYGRDFDPMRSFMSQYADLLIATPKINLSNDSVSQNSNYVNQTTHVNNCYLVFDADMDESCMYANAIKHSTYSIDCSHLYYSDHCYQCVNCTKCYQCKRSTECEYSTNLQHCLRCIRCTNCYECVNLVDKQYCIRNVQYTKEEYERLIATRNFDQQSFDDFTRQFPLRASYMIQSEGSFGNNIALSKQCVITYNMGNCNDCRYSSLLNDAKDCYDYDVRGMNAQYIYEAITVGENAHTVFSCVECRVDTARLYYCHYCIGCKDCFGCVSLQNKQYCIFNKQYTKEEYEKKVSDIIEHMIQGGEWGEFFDHSLSLFGYNETIAQDYYPLTREEALARGYAWYDHNTDPKIPDNAPVLKPQDYDDATRNTKKDDDAILRQIIVCETSGRPFMIQKAELELYRKYQLPLPRQHYEVRYSTRKNRIPTRTLYLRTCDKTSQDMLSVFPANYASKVYSQQAYADEVFG